MSQSSARNHELRLQWALKHLQDIEANIQGWLGGNPYRLSDEFDPQRGENVVRVHILQQPPSSFSLAIGDCLHNLRSALDNLVYELAVAYTGSPLPEEVAEKSEFPVFWERPMTAGERKRKIGGIAPDAQTIIEGLQPHLRGQNYASDSLWLLHELSRRDKHRLLHLTLFSHVGSGVIANEGFVEKFISGARGPVENDTEIAQYIVRPIRPGAKVDVQLGFHFDVAFSQGPPANGEPVVTVLSRLRDYILSDVVPPLRPFL